MTSRERAELLAESFGGWTESAIETVRMAIDAAVAEKLEAAANNILGMMERLGTNYRHEIADAVRAHGAK
jgi:hypothetical protein